MIKNIFDSIPKNSKTEVFEEILNHKNVKIERIVSSGQTTPENEAYLQNQAEWVIVLEGKADILFCDDNITHNLKKGDFLFIPEQCKHRVIYTDTSCETVWLAIHIS